ncbi:MAG: cupin domain-containing protein [Actinobacteria bacterium]|nr:cupin domain-containing protein [Actinomycetota bacterium]
MSDVVVPGVVVHWDEAEGREVDQGPFGARWTDLGKASDTVSTGVRRIEIRPGKRSTPAHAHTAEEEIFYVLGGTGLSWQDGAVFEVAAGDCLVHLPRGEAHTLIGGDEGLDVLVFSTRRPVEACRLPRAGVSWLGPSWVTSGDGGHPWGREMAAGELECPAPSARPARISTVGEVAPREVGRGGFQLTIRDLARAAGSRDIGLRHAHLAEGMLSYPLHCHSAEEEVFVVLEGQGSFLLGDEEHDLRPGCVVARPSGTGKAHALRGGADGITYLAFGERSNNDMTWYPNSTKISFRGLGVIGRLEPLSYYDGEVPDDEG